MSNKKLIPLKEFNKRIRESLYPTYPKLNGIECHECGGEMMDESRDILMTSPPQKRIICSNEDCHHRDLRITQRSE